MKFWICFIVAALILACKSKNQQPDGLAEESVKSDSTALATEETDASWRKIDSVGEIKNLIFKEFQQHQGDSAYSHFTMFIDQNGTIYQFEIHIGQLFHPSLKSAVLGWHVSDSTMDIEVFHFQKGGWKSVLKSQKLPATNGGTAVCSEFL